MAEKLKVYPGEPNVMPRDEYVALIQHGIISERLLALGWGPVGAQISIKLDAVTRDAAE